MNTRRAWAVGLVVVLAGCQDARSPLDITPPDFAVSDGAHGGNTHFYFLPPLVPTPTFSGEFNPLVKPTVVISELPDPTSEACSPGTVIRTFKTEIAVDPVAETYSVNYNTGTDLTTGQDYRICVRIGGAMLGFRDIHPDANGADVPRNTDQLPIYQFNNGRNLPIKFRIEKGTLCSLDAIDCTETTLDAAGGTAVCDDGLCGLQVPEGALTDEFTFVVQVVECTRDGDGRINWLPTDLPQFGACLEIHNEGDAEWTGFAFEAVAGACIDAPGLSHEQFDRLQLHHLRESDGVVEALPNRAAGFLTCGEIASSAPLSKKLMYYAGKGLRKMQYAVAPWLGAPPLQATDRGFGGGLTDESPMAWALPAQMEKVNWTNPVIGTAGEARDVTALVTDEAGDPVENARVTFEVTDGDGPPVGPVSVWTGADGLAKLPQWTLGPAGTNTLLATGRGIGTTAAEGGTGPFSDHVGSIVDLGTGVLTYQALVCDPSQTPNQVDGRVLTGEYANSTNFTAKISGGSTPATLYWTNDCQNIYFGLEVTAAAEINNELLLVFDNDNDGKAEVGDDLWSLKRNSKTGQVAFVDRFLPISCLGSKQASCGTDDTAAGGTNDLLGQVAFDGTKGVTVYEIRHPLKGDVGRDIQVNIAQGGTVGVYLQLQLGSGAQGNTQWPGFRVYQPIMVSPPSP